MHDHVRQWRLSTTWRPLRLCLSILCAANAVHADTAEKVLLRLVALKEGGRSGELELVNHSGKTIQLWQSSPFPEEGAPFEAGFDTGQYWSNGNWHSIGGQDVGGPRPTYAVKAGKRFAFDLDLTRFSRLREGTLVRVRVEFVGGGVFSEPFRWRMTAAVKVSPAAKKN